MTRPLSLNCSLGNSSVTRCTTILFVMHDKKGCYRQSPVFSYTLSLLFVSVLRCWPRNVIFTSSVYFS